MGLESAMKINNLPDKPAGAATGAGKPADRLSAATPQRTAEPDPGVTVSISAAASQTLSASVARSNTDVFNAKKVEAVKNAIANGSFTVNAEAIADKLLSNARDMLGVASK
jgi:negative regulator of flagellin synthesis FlgM